MPAAADRVSPAAAAAIAARYYGVEATAERLASEHDDTFRLVAADGTGTAGLLKISLLGPGDARGSAGAGAGEGDSASLPTAVLGYLAEAAPRVPAAAAAGRAGRPGADSARAARGAGGLP